MFEEVPNIRVPQEWFFGPKHQEALRASQGAIMLEVHADVVCRDWAALVVACRSAFDAIPNLGVWSPELSGTPWTTWRVRTHPLERGSIQDVVCTDALVWALHEDLVSASSEWSIAGNNLGWGLDWATCAEALASGKRVVRDLSIQARHRRGSGYVKTDAGEQEAVFFSQFTSERQALIQLMHVVPYLNARIRHPGVKRFLDWKPLHIAREHFRGFLE